MLTVLTCEKKRRHQAAYKPAIPYRAFFAPSSTNLFDTLTSATDHVTYHMRLSTSGKIDQEVYIYL